MSHPIPRLPRGAFPIDACSEYRAAARAGKPGLTDGPLESPGRARRGGAGPSPSSPDDRGACAVHEVYCYGLPIGGNPSRVGGAWAFSHVASNGRPIRLESCVMTPAEFDLVEMTGELVELLAVINAVATTPRRWRGRIFADLLRPRRGLLWAQSASGVRAGPRCAVGFL